MKPGISHQTHSAARKKNGFVDALVIHNPDLSLYLKLQNLLNYFLECLNQITASVKKDQCVQHLNLCVDHIKTVGTEKSGSFDPEISRLLKEFLEEANVFESLLKAISSDNAQNSFDQPVDILIPAKASNLHWVAVCILEELKKPFSHT